MTVSAASHAVDVVAVLRMDTGVQVFPAARPLRATVFERADLMEQPLEDGSEVTDHIVFRPTEIDLPLVILGETAPAVFEEIRQLWRDGILLIVQTMAASYTSMALVELPHDENPDELGRLTVGVKLREAKFVKATYGGLAPKQVKAKPKASTAKRGAQQTSAATGPQTAAVGSQYRGSTLYQLTHRGG